MTYYGDLERLPRFQNVATTFSELLEGFLQLSYSNQRASLGAVDYEKGFKADLIGGANFVQDDLIPILMFNFDFGFALPWKHSSLWLRSSVGAAYGEPNDPFANFFFGGFGNNWIDRLSVKRYREAFAFPGVELNEIGGRNYGKTMLEWNFPPLRFRNVGSPGFHLSWMRASLFTGAIRTNFDDETAVKDPVNSPEREVGNVGTQIDLRFRLLSRLDMTLSLGYAVAAEEGRSPEEEFMFSLKVLH